MPVHANPVKRCCSCHAALHLACPSCIVNALAPRARWHYPSCQVALNWLICKGAVPIPGAKNAAQATANAGALGWRLTGGEVEELDELAIEGTLKLGQNG